MVLTDVQGATQAEKSFTGTLVEALMLSWTRLMLLCPSFVMVTVLAT